MPPKLPSQVSESSFRPENLRVFGKSARNLLKNSKNLWISFHINMQNIAGTLKFSIGRQQEDAVSNGTRFHYSLPGDEVDRDERASL